MDYKRRLHDHESIELHRLAQVVSKYGSVLYRDMDFEKLAAAMTKLNTHLLSISLRQKDEPLGKPDCIVCAGQGWVFDYLGTNKECCPCIEGDN